MLTLSRLRRLFLDVHLWLGVGLALVLIPLGLSGSALVFHDELERLLEPQRFAVSQGSQAPPSAYLAAAREAFGEPFAAAQIRYPDEAGSPVSVVGRATSPPAPGTRPKSRTAFLDPPTARVLDVADPRGGFFGAMHILHGSLFIPQIGRKVVGWLGWAMTISCVTGLWLWWPRTGSALKGLRWRRSPSTNTNLHHMAGFWILIPLAVVSLTGIYISFPQSARGVAQIVTPMSPARPGGGRGPADAPLTETRTDIDQVLQAAIALRPGMSIASIAVPSRGRKDEPPMWRVALRHEGAAQPVTVEVNDQTGVARAPATADPLPGDDMPRLMRRIHDGIGMGMFWRSLVFLTGIAPTLLAITGTIMWLRRRTRLALRPGVKPAQAAAS